MSKNREKTVKNIEKPSKPKKKAGINYQKYQKTRKKPSKKKSKTRQKCRNTGKKP